MWSLGVALAIVAAAMRSSPFVGDYNAWDILYGLGLLICLAAAFGQAGRSSAARYWPRFILPLWILVGFSALSTALHNSVSQFSTVAQFLLVAVVLTGTARWRWVTPAKVHRDVKFVVLILSSLIGASLAVGIGGDPRAFGFFENLAGVFVNVNYLGLACALTIPASLSIALTGGRLWSLFAVISVAAAAALILSGSRGSLVGAVAGTVVVLAVSSRSRELSGRAQAMAVLIVCAGAGAFILGGSSFFSRESRGADITSGRLEIWANILDTSGFWGQGALSTQVADVVFTPEGAFLDQSLAAHNLVLEAYSGLGLIGASIVVVLLIAPIAGRSGYPERTAAIGAYVALLVYETTESSLFGFGGPVTFAAWLLLAAASTGEFRNSLKYSKSRAPRQAPSRVSAGLGRGWKPNSSGPTSGCPSG